MRRSEDKTKKVQLKNHTIYMENDLLFIFTKGGNSDGKIALEAKEIILGFIKQRTNIKVLIDINKSGRSTPEARKIWIELSRHESIDKIAFVGLHMVARVLAVFYIKLSGNGKSRFFNNTEEALKWFKNDSL
jgi:hypothetical protein